MGNVNISIADIPSGICYSTPSVDWPILVAYLEASLSGSLNSFNFGNSVPSADDRDKPWFRTNSDGSPDAIYAYSLGYWLSKHPLPPGAVIMWEGAEADIDAFDGGETATVSTIAGPFWEKVTEMGGRSPIMPGSLPTTSSAVTINNNYGNEQLTLALKNIPPHSHDITSYTSGATGGDGGHILNKPDPGDEVTHQTKYAGGTSGTTDGTSETTPIDLLHPVRAIWFLRRTSRTYRRI